MRTTTSVRRFAPCIVLLLAACAASPSRDGVTQESMQNLRIASEHFDDLLSGGLGIEGLRSLTPPAFADAAHPTATELRRRSLWSNWRGIADLTAGGGYGEVYGSLTGVPGREFHAFMRLPGAKQPHRVMLQVPDAFDSAKRCLVVTASSGSRGIYGAIALAGAWGLPRGCAVVYTDKAAGTDYVDLQHADEQVRLDGTRRLGIAADAVDGQESTAFDLSDTPAETPRIAYKHAHSQDNPEADWGRHVQQAVEFGLHALARALPDEAPFTFENTRVIATGLSNGGGAVLRAAELDKGWLDGVVVTAPNVWPAEGGRALYDYATEAAIYMPCALLHARFDTVAMARPGGAHPAAALQRCESLHAAGLLAGEGVAAQAQDALDRLHAGGWSDAAIEAGALSVAFDLWRGVAIGYSSAYSRSPAQAMPCGYAYAALDAPGTPRAATAEERAAWWSDATGIPPGTGVGLIDALSRGEDPSLPGLRCLRSLWDDQSAPARSLRAGVEGTRAALPRAGLPMIVIHGADDGLVPEAFSGGAYARWAREQGRDLRYWRVSNAQHFDAFLGLPAWAPRYVPLLPYAYRALDAMWAHLVDHAPLPESADIAATPRGAGANGIAPLASGNLALP